MKTSFAVVFAVLFLPSLSNYAAEPSGKIAVRVISIVENRASDLSGENIDFPFTPGLSVALELSGPPIPKATHWGKLAVEKAVDDRGAALELQQEPFDELQEIMRMPRFFVETEKKLDDRIRIELAFKASARAATAIKALEGSFSVRVAEKKDVLVAAPGTLVGKAVEDRTLKAAGVSLEVVEFTPDGPEYMKLSAQDTENAIAELDIVDAQGESLVSSRGSMRIGDENAKKELSLGGNDKLPADARLKITVITSRADLPVALRFADLPLP